MMEQIYFAPHEKSRGMTQSVTSKGLKFVRFELGPSDCYPIPEGCRTFLVLFGNPKIRFWVPPRDWWVKDLPPGSLTQFVSGDELAPHVLSKFTDEREQLREILIDSDPKAHAVVIGFFD